MVLRCYFPHHFFFTSLQGLFSFSSEFCLISISIFYFPPAFFYFPSTFFYFPSVFVLLLLSYFVLLPLCICFSLSFLNTSLQHHSKKIPVISPNFLVWTFCGRTQFPHSCGRIPRNYAETIPFHKISTSEN